MTGAVSVVMMGATGAVGGVAVRTLSGMQGIGRLTLLGRRPVDGLSGVTVAQPIVDPLNPDSYAQHLPGHDAAICTLGVGEPSKISREDFVRIDKTAVLAFASACKASGVRHFSLLCSVGAHAGSRNFYLRTKGELEDGLRALAFERLSLFQPSVILTDRNRYGFSQALVLAIMPWLNPLLPGPLRRFRAIHVSVLGRAIARNLMIAGSGAEVLWFDDISRIGRRQA